MKKSLLLVATSVAFAGSVFAQTPPAAMATTAPNATAPSARAGITTPATSSSTPSTPDANVSGVCKDGSAFNAASTKGACRGHGGIDKKAVAATSGAPSASTPASVAPAAPVTGKPVAKTDLSQAAPAPGGGAGKVWANDSSKVYHCQSDKYYGKTKHGEYLTEADAKVKGFHAEHGKVCG